MIISEEGNTSISEEGNKMLHAPFMLISCAYVKSSAKYFLSESNESSDRGVS